MFLFKRKNGFYYVYFNDPLSNKRKSQTTKCKDKKSAVSFLKSFIKNDSKPVNPVIYLETLESEVIKYVTDNLTKSSLMTYLTAFKHLRNIIGNKPIKLYCARDIELYKQVRMQTVSKTSCNIELRVLKALFNLAIKWNWLDRNPLKDVKEFHIPEKKPLSFSDTEIKLIYDNIQRPFLKDIVRFTLLTGCRINEVLNVQYKDINLSERILNIVNKETFKTKSGKNRFIPINDSLLELLTRIMKQSNVYDLTYPETYLFNKNGFRYNRDFVSKEFKKVLRKAGIDEKFHFHSLRHSYIMQLVRAGVNVRYIQQIAGHSSLSVTEHYIFVNVNDLRSAVNMVK